MWVPWVVLPIPSVVYKRTTWGGGGGVSRGVCYPSEVAVGGGGGVFTGGM